MHQIATEYLRFVFERGRQGVPACGEQRTHLFRYRSQETGQYVVKVAAWCGSVLHSAQLLSSGVGYPGPANETALNLRVCSISATSVGRRSIEEAP